MSVASVSIASGDGGVLRMAAEDTSIFSFTPRAARSYGMCNVLLAYAIRAYGKKGRFPMRLSPPFNPKPRYV
jgi:hypothetical protein